jgi:nucleoside-diphosphate-sugar epimerase
MDKERVLLTGASGSMGFEAFKLLWEKRDQYDIVLLLRPSNKNKKLFRKYVKAAEQNGGIEFKIVWGDVQQKEDVVEACQGIDYCLHPMALISPAADRNPEMAHRVNYLGTKYIVEAIEAQDPDHIRLVSIGSVAEYGDRMPPIHHGRTGDPIVPSVYDHYALTKIQGELEVMQSRIRHRVSLRQTFIMIPGLFSLMDPIMFHQPINSFMENITSRDSGRLLVKCLEVPGNSEFWGGYYNISGGPGCRTTFLEFLDRIYSMLGLNYRNVMERNWFALKNFHMMFYEDSGRLNEFLDHWEGGQSMEDFYKEVWKKMPGFLKVTAWFCKYIPPYRWLVEKITHGQLHKLALKEEGTLRWLKDGEKGRIEAFFGSEEAHPSIPEWGENMPSLDHEMPHKRFDHGYDESKDVFEIADLEGVASFRGGSIQKDGWKGDMHQKVKWTCGQNHDFELTPHAVLRGGHWCFECISPPWEREAMIKSNRFAAQTFTGGQS